MLKGAFKWIDYTEVSHMFIKGLNYSVANLRKKSFRLTIHATNYKHIIKASSLEEAKIESEKFIKVYCKNVYNDVKKINELLG